MDIIFFGTPEYASAILGALAESSNRVICSVSQPDRPKGRGNKLEPTPVKALSTSLGIPVLQPESIRESGFSDILKAYGADIFVVAAFGQLLPGKILKIPPYGCINAHASLLPKYRGASPITQSIINGDETTGVTIMQMDKGMDTGGIIHTLEIKIDPDDTAGTLLNKLTALGAAATVEAIELISAGKARAVPQNNSEATYAPLLTKDMGRLDFSLSAERIANLVRGLDPWPGAFTQLNGGVLKILKAIPCAVQPPPSLPGCVLSTANGTITVACGDGAIAITEIQMPGGKRLTVPEYLRGHNLPDDAVLG